MVAGYGITISLPFPPLPSRLGEQVGDGLRLRRFGSEATDLDIDFDRPGPQLVTDVIASCARRLDGSVPSAELITDLTVSARIVCLLLLAALEGAETLDVPLACQSPNCQPFEVDLTLDEILAYAQTDLDEPITVVLEGESISFRRPTGRDQIAWLGQGFQDAHSARLAILRSLALSGLAADLDEAELPKLEALLDESDPLVCFSLTAACPTCEAHAVHEIALADRALRILRAAQLRLVESIHLIASRYGWSEAAVMQIPAWRRQRYLTLIGTTS